MDDSDTVLIKAVVHYQQCLEKYTRRNNEPRMLYCIGKLYKMPITVEHLEQTGVGRTVNSLRKFNGQVGDAAKSLVAKWKEMVVGEDNEPKDSSVKPESSKSHREESSKNRKHKEGSSSSSHKESDKKNKHEYKEKSSSSFSNGEESHSKKLKEESKYKKSDENYKKDKESNHYKHKSSKRKQSSDNSESDDNEYEKSRNSNHKHKSAKRKPDSDNSDSDDNEYEKMKSNSHKHKSSKQLSEETASEDESRYKVEKDKRESHKQKLSKRKREDSDYDDEEYEEVNAKQKKYSEDEESESEIEQKEVKIPANKYHSKHKDESNNVAREKNKNSAHKYKDKKEKKEHLAENKPKKYGDDHKIKDKQSNKEKIKSSSEKKEKEENDKKSKQGSSKHHDKEHKSPKKSSSHGSKGKVTVFENGIGSDSGTSFAEALGMLEPTSSKANKKKIAIIHPFPVEKPTDANNSSPDISKPETSDLLIQKKLEPLDINISNLLPEITPNYRPIGNFSLDNGQSKNKVTTEEEALSAIMYSKILRTKVFSGNKVIYGNVPTLFDLCTHVLQDNIDALEYTGGVPYSILKPVIERANPDQLFMLEHHNPYLIEDTDELWQLHCQKEFRPKKREEMETWRDMYMRCLDEREAKLKALTANIKQSQDKSLPVRQTKLAYVDGHSIVKPPRSIARKQAKHGTAGVEKKPLVTPSSRLSALATAGAAGQIAVPNPGSRAAAAAGSSSAAMKPKKAPLMQKTLAFMKNRLFRR